MQTFNFNNSGALYIILLSIGVAVWSNDFILSCLSAALISLSLSYIALGTILRVPPAIPDIPAIPNNSIFGYSKYLNGEGKSHLVMLEHAEKYGKNPGCCQFEFMGKRYVVVFDSQMAKRVLRDVHGKGSIHENLTPGTPLNTFSLDTNSSWSQRRSLFRHPFSATVLKQFENSIHEIVSNMCDSLDEVAASEDSVELDVVFQKLAMDVICKVAFQYTLEGKFSSAHEKISKSFELIQKVIMFPRFLLRLPRWMLGSTVLGLYKEIHIFLDELASDIFKTICALEESKNLKANSLAKAIFQFSQMPGITTQQVKSEIRLMFIAGFETTAHTLSFFFYSLATNSTIQLEIQKSIDTMQCQNSTLMPSYVEAVLKESMRKYPTAANGSTRLVRDEAGYILKKGSDEAGYILKKGNDDADEFNIPKGFWLLVDIFSLQNCSHNWERPNEFLPQRWLDKDKTEDDLTEVSDNDDESKRERNPLTSPSAFGGIGKTSAEGLSFSPFSYGPRNCLGMNLSLLEIRIVIIKMVLRYSFELADKSLLDDSIMTETYLTMRPKNKLPMHLIRRD